MSKLQSYELRKLGQQVVDFSDDVQDLLNNGKYQASVATTGVPAWNANTGEFAFFSSGSDRRLYIRASSSWQIVAAYDITLLSTSFGTPVSIETANLIGVGTPFARHDHMHMGYLQVGSSQSFTASGTWTRPSGISRIFARVWGGGGGGGEAGAAGQTGNTGSGGGSSSFGSAIAANGGSGGGGGSAAGVTPGGGGAGGAGSAGMTLITGGNGRAMQQATDAGDGGTGGGGGGGAGRGATGAIVVGNAGQVPGGGGGGATAAATFGNGGGGGGGGYAEGFTEVTGNVTVTVGAGGAGGTGASGADGGAGAAGAVIVYW